MGDASDEELVERFRQSGEVRFFDELVNRHIGRVRGMIYPMVLNGADADELTQEVFLRVAKGLLRFRGRARFSTWLYRIAMNSAHSFLSKRSRSAVEVVADPPDRKDESPGPAEVAAVREKDAGIMAALASLSRPLRAAITLTAIQGMSAREAARVEECPLPTMYWRIHEARRTLRVRLGGYLNE